MPYKDLETARRTDRERYWANRDRELARGRAYRASHQRQAVDRRYRESHREERRAYQSNYDLAHRAENNERERDRRRRKPEYMRAYRKVFVDCFGHRIYLMNMPPEVKNLGLLLKQTRQAIRERQKGVTP